MGCGYLWTLGEAVVELLSEALPGPKTIVYPKHTSKQIPGLPLSKPPLSAALTLLTREGSLPAAGQPIERGL